MTKTQPASFPVESTNINLLSELLDRSPPDGEKLQVELWSEKTGFKLQFISNRTYILCPISFFVRQGRCTEGPACAWDSADYFIS